MFCQATKQCPRYSKKYWTNVKMSYVRSVLIYLTYIYSNCNSRYCLLYQLIIVTVTARMLFGTDAHVV